MRRGRKDETECASGGIEAELGTEDWVGILEIVEGSLKKSDTGLFG